MSTSTLPRLAVAESPYRVIDATPVLNPALSPSARGLAVLIQVAVTPGASVDPHVLVQTYGIPADQLRPLLRELALAGYLQGDTDGGTWFFTGAGLGAPPVLVSSGGRRKARSHAGDEHDSARLAAFERAVAEANLRPTRQVSRAGGIGVVFAELAALEPPPAPDEVYEATKHAVRTLRQGAWVRFERVSAMLAAWRVEQDRLARLTQGHRAAPLEAMTRTTGQEYRDDILGDTP